MALFPKYTSTQPKDREILGSMEEFYIRSVGENQAYMAEASLDARFESGDQQVYSELYNAPINKRQIFGFNRITRIVNMVSGHQRQNRKSFTVTPVENGDDETAGQLTKTLLWVNKQEHVLNTISDAFQGALISGMNMLQVWVDYMHDPINGDLKIDNCPYNTFLIDPFFKKADLSDCNAVWKRTYLTHGQCVSLLPDHKEDILGLMADGTLADEKFMFMPEVRSSMSNNLLAYDEYYYRSYRKQRCLVDTQTGEVMEWRSNDEDRLKEFLRRFPQVVVNDQTIPTVSLAIVVQGKVFYNGETLSDKYPFIPVFGYFRPDLPGMSSRIQGMVRGLRDPQYLYNRTRLNQLDMLESVPTTGLIYKEDALVDPDEAFMTGQGRAVAIKSTAQMSDVQQIIPPQVPPSMLQLSDVLSQELQQISGVNEELLGSAVDDKAGILSMLRQSAGLTTLQGLFDSLDRSQKLLGSLLVEIIQNNFTHGKIKRILAEEPTQEFYNKNFGKYDCVIEDGIDTATQKQMAFSQMLHLKEMGIPIPDDAIMKNITVENKKDILESMQVTSEKQQQAEQKQREMQLLEIQTNMKLMESKMREQDALARERMTRSVANLGLAQERVHESTKDDSQAKLNYIKTLSELEDMDIAKLEKLVALSQMLEAPSQQEEALSGDQELQQLQQQQVEQPMEQQQQVEQPVENNNAPL